jgi:hypothetical protein
MDNTYMTPPRTRLYSDIYNGMSGVIDNNGERVERVNHFTPFYLWLSDFVKNKYNGTKRYQIRLNADDLDALDELIKSGEFKRKYKFESDVVDLSNVNYEHALAQIRNGLVSWRKAIRRKSNKSPKEIWYLFNGIETFPLN